MPNRERALQLILKPDDTTRHAVLDPAGRSRATRSVCSYSLINQCPCLTGWIQSQIQFSFHVRGHGVIVEVSNSILFWRPRPSQGTRRADARLSRCCRGRQWKATRHPPRRTIQSLRFGRQPSGWVACEATCLCRLCHDFLNSWRCRNATYPRTAHYKDSTVSVAHKLVVVEVGRLPSCRFPHPSSSPL